MISELEPSIKQLLYIDFKKEWEELKSTNIYKFMSDEERLFAMYKIGCLKETAGRMGKK